jgi:hypothetical protein
LGKKDLFNTSSFYNSPVTRAEEALADRDELRQLIEALQ